MKIIYNDVAYDIFSTQVDDDNFGNTWVTFYIYCNGKWRWVNSLDCTPSDSIDKSLVL